MTELTHCCTDRILPQASLDVVSWQVKRCEGDVEIRRCFLKSVLVSHLLTPSWSKQALVREEGH